MSSKHEFISDLPATLPPASSSLPVLDPMETSSRTTQLDPSTASSPPPSLSKSLSFSKLSAKAAEFVPRMSSASSVAVPNVPLGQGGFHGTGYLLPFYGGHQQEVLRPFMPADVAELEKGKRGGGAASGGKVGLSDDVSRKILNQVEYYFSDLNLATTDNLIRRMHKDPEGYVPMSVVSSFKKIKSSISSDSQLAKILRRSDKLVVSDDGKRVKRITCLTESDMEELQSRIVVAENLPEDHCHQSLMKIFSAVGSVRSIRTCPPQSSNDGSSATSRTTKTEGSHYSNKLHAFAEYESAELAEKAVTELNDKNNWRNGLKVRLLITKPKANSYQARMKKSGNENDPDARSPEESDANDLAGEDDGEHTKNRNRGKGKGRGRPQYQASKSRGGIMGSPPSVHILASHEQVIGNNKQSSVPRMPDGTRGFSMGRGKPVAIKSA